jgi:hypothetical protein
MVRANEAFLKLANPETKIASSRGGVVAGRAEVSAFRDMLATARDRSRNSGTNKIIDLG